MGCFDSGSQTTTQTVQLPAWLEEASKGNIEEAKKIADRPYAAYPNARIAPFSEDSQSAFDMIRGYGDKYTPGNESTTQTASTAPIMQYSNPRLIDNIPGTGPTAGSLQDYMNPYVSAVLTEQLREMQRQSDISKKGIDAKATMAGAFGDTGHALELSENQRNTERSKADYTNRILAQAFSEAMGLRGQDLNRMLETFRTNEGAYEGGLQRAIGGESQDLNNFLKYIQALGGSGATQEAKAQQSADLGYQDFLRQFATYPEALLNILNSTTSGAPHGSTTTGETPTSSPFAQGLGTAVSLASLFI